MNYYIADMHLSHRNQTDEGNTNHDGRPFATVEEMNQYFLEHWNGTVTNADTVYILGDIAMRCDMNDLITFVSQLKGRKVLIKGNHDRIDDYRYRQLFAEICDYKELVDSYDGKSYKLVLCHYPILMWNGQHNGVIHLYGHTHNTPEDWFYERSLAEMNDPQKHTFRTAKEWPFRAINVGSMKTYISFQPRTLKEIFSAIPELDFEEQKRRTK